MPLSGYDIIETKEIINRAERKDIIGSLGGFEFKASNACHFSRTNGE